MAGPGNTRWWPGCSAIPIRPTLCARQAIPGSPQLARTVPANLSSPDDLARIAETRTTSISPSSGRSAAERRRGRPLRGGEPTAVRSDARSRRARIEQGLRESVHDASSRADRAISNVRQRGRRDGMSIRAGEFGFPVVLKADGLAAGKGVVIAADREDAEAAITAAMTDAAIRRRGSVGW